MPLLIITIKVVSGHLCSWVCISVLFLFCFCFCFLSCFGEYVWEKGPEWNWIFYSYFFSFVDRV